MLRRTIQILVLMLISGSASAGNIKAFFGSDAARFSYATEAFGQQFGRLEMEFGGIITDYDDQQRQDDFLTYLGLLVRGESLDFPLIAAIGGRVYYGEASTYDIGGVALGGDLLLLPESWGGFGIGAFLYHAPDVVSFRDAESLTEYGVFVSFQITPQASVVLGYQNIEADIENVGTAEFDDGGYFGFDIRF